MSEYFRTPSGLYVKRHRQYRMKGYDYSTAGYYFVTCVTKNRINWFGVIKNHKLLLNDLGEYASKCFSEINSHFPHILIDEYIIMPNHIHGILVIDSRPLTVEADNQVGDNNYCPQPGNDVPWQTKWAKSISSAIRGFKIGVTKYARNNQNNYEFKWQRSFHDRIIRDEKEYLNVKRYISNNPRNWEGER